MTANKTQTIRSICKKHGIKGCRKMTHGVFVGKQCQRIAAEKAVAFIQDIEAAGFYVENTTKSIAFKGLFDATVVY